MYKKILLPTDGSGNAKKALTQGMKLASAIKANVTVLYVVDTSSFVTLPETMVWDNMRTLLLEEGEKALSEAKKTAEKYKLKIKSVLKEGRPSDEITKTSKDDKFDLIIMGTAGRTGLDKLFLGSVSEKVARSSPVSVLIVK